MKSSINTNFYVRNLVRFTVNVTIQWILIARASIDDHFLLKLCLL